MKTKILTISLILITFFIGLVYVNTMKSNCYHYILKQYNDSRKINPVFVEGNRALFGQDLIPGEQDVKLDLEFNLKKANAHKNIGLKGNGDLIINQSKYPIYLAAGNIEKKETKNGRDLFWGQSDGYMMMHGQKVKLAAAIFIMSKYDKKLITITFSTPGQGIPALVFGEPFQESADFLTKLKEGN